MSSSERLIGVIGAGTMGSGIAQAAATAGFVVQLFDAAPDAAEKAHARVTQRLEDRAATGKMPRNVVEDSLARLHVGKDIAGLKNAECVIEAVTEDLLLKRKIFADLEKAVSPGTLLASNTSSLAIAKIAEALQSPQRFLGMHFFNPAPVMNLIELVQGPTTSEETMVKARAVCAKLDKTAVKVKDSPGFIGNRVNRPFYLEALRLLETGEADIRGIDTAIKQVGGFKMGPFELLDLIGLDVNLSVTKSVWTDFGKPSRFAPNAIQERLVEAGHLGRKSGRGFYHHNNGEPTPAYESKARDTSSWKPSPALQRLATGLGKPADRNLWLFARILLAVINEGAWVADTIALPRDVDLTMELGFNYPQGPLGFADYVGLDIILPLMQDFFTETHADERYKPHSLLENLVAAGKLGEKSAKGFLFHAL